jgi:hypothetical protein
MQSVDISVSLRQLSMYSASEIEAIMAFAREARWIADRDADASVSKMLRKLASIFERIVNHHSVRETGEPDPVILG